jgi:hypothetical protein
MARTYVIEDYLDKKIPVRHYNGGFLVLWARGIVQVCEPPPLVDASIQTRDLEFEAWTIVMALRAD